MFAVVLIVCEYTGILYTGMILLPLSSWHNNEGGMKSSVSHPLGVAGFCR